MKDIGVRLLCLTRTTWDRDVILFKGFIKCIRVNPIIIIIEGPAEKVKNNQKKMKIKGYTYQDQIEWDSESELDGLAMGDQSRICPLLNASENSFLNGVKI